MSSAVLGPTQQGGLKSTRLIKNFLLVNQLAYAITAFPIGTVLSVAPVFLFKDRNVSITKIGFFMAGGELLGIGAMVLAEHYEDGFIFRRPYDLYFINATLAIVLILIPVWREDLWFLAATCVMLVQTFNSASKPVVSEAIHRLSIMTQKESHIVFAQANTWRRIGNATIGFCTPLIYALHIRLPFFLVGGIMLVYLGIVYFIDFKIKSIYNSSSGSRSSIERNVSEDFLFSQRIYNERQGFSASTTSSGSSNRSRKRTSTISMLKSYRRRETSNGGGVDVIIEEEEGDESSSSLVLGPQENESNNEPTLKKEICGFGEATSVKEPLEEGSKKSPDPEKKEFEGFNDIYDEVAYYLIVWMFPFFDAVITRLPFAYLMIALEAIPTWAAALCLFGYQMGRAISQQIQVWRCDTLVNYVLNSIALVAYIAFVIYVQVLPETEWRWCIFVLFTGCAETLPIQQLYLSGLFGEVDEDDMSLRNAVKASHTWTGVGSMIAFLVGSQAFYKFKLRGVSCMGLTVMVLKIGVNILIDLLHNRKEEKTKRKIRNSQEAYAKMFTSMRFGDSY